MKNLKNTNDNTNYNYNTLNKEEEKTMNNNTLNNDTLNNNTLNNTMNKEEERTMNNTTQINMDNVTLFRPENRPEIISCMNDYTQEIIKKINSVTGADFERDSSDAIRRLMNIANEYDIDYDDSLYNFVTDDDVEEYIKFELDSRRWDLMDLVNFMRGVNFDHDDLYIMDYGKLYNVTLENFEHFKEDLIYNLEEPSHYITVRRVSNTQIYGVNISSQTRSQYNSGSIFGCAYPEHTYDLGIIYEDFDVEEESEEFFKDVEDQLIDSYIDEYLEEHHLHRGRVEIFWFD